LLQRCLGWQETREAARDVSTDRKPTSTGAAIEMSLLTGPPDSSEGCQSALVDKFGVSPISSSMVHITNHPGMNRRPIKAAVL
jgi:hypothetical protein